MDMAAIFFNGAEPFEQIQQKAPCEIWWILLKQLQRRTHLKITQFYTYIVQWQGQITLSKFQPLVFN